MGDHLPTALLVSAQIRLAAMEGVPITLLRKGDPDRGSILLKINLLNGLFRLLLQVRLDGQTGWMHAAGAKDLTESQADAYLARQTDMDPDLWALEIEDKAGRHWFDGDILDL